MLSRCLAVCLGLLLAPVWLACALAIVLLMGRPVLFLQTRVGLHRRPFTICKFRSMADGRVTPLGRLLRATGLDELPQLLNVARGEMCFVGPRPLTLADVERLRWNTPFHDLRWSVPPGLTGPAQLSTRCHAKISWHHDRHYVRHRSAMLDLRVLLQSACVPWLGKALTRHLIGASRRRSNRPPPAPSDLTP